MIEKCVKYNDDFQKMKLQKIIFNNNKIKLLDLVHSGTLDNFIFPFVTNKYYQYGTLKWSEKNITEA